MAIGGSADLLFRIKTDPSDASKGLNKIKQDLRETGTAAGSLGASFSSASGAVSSFLGNLAANAVASFTSALATGGKAVLDYSSRMEQTKVAFTSLTGSAQLAAKHLEELKKFAIDTPFEFEGLAKASQRLQGANVELTKIIPLMRSIGNVVAATGETSEDRLNGITTAISQMIAKGKVSAEEMEQMSERGVNAWDILSKATGKTQAELRKLSEQGALSSDVMVKSLQKIGSEKFGDAMEKQSKTFAGSMSNIKDILMQTAATAFEPLYKQITGMAGRFAAEITAKKNDYKALGETIAKYIGEGLGAGIGAVLSWFGTYIGRRLKEIFTEGKFVDSVTKSLFTGLSRGITNGLGLTKADATPTQATPKVFNYNRPYDNQTTSGSVPLGATNPETLEKQRKDREAVLRQQLDLVLKYNQLEIEAAKLKFDKIKNVTLDDIRDFQVEVANLMSDAFNKPRVGESPDEFKVRLKEYENDIQRFWAETDKLKDDLREKQVEKEKQSSEDQIKSAEATANRQTELAKASAQTRLAQLQADRDRGIITEVEYAQATAEIQIGALEGEKKRLQESLTGLDKRSEKYKDVTHAIKLLDEELTQAQIENARKIEEAIARADNARASFLTGDKGEKAEDGVSSAPGDSRRGIFDGWTESWQAFVDTVEGSVGIGNIISGIADLATGAMQGMANAVGSAVEGWLLYGDSIGKALKKALAAELAHIAGVATVKALYATALGFLRLAEWDLVGAGHAFVSAGLWAALAVGTGLAARALSPQNAASSTFSAQSSQATGTNRSGSGGSGGSVYSSFGNDASVVNVGRNAPSGAAAPQVVEVRFKERTGWFSEMFEVELGKNNKLRSLIIDTAAG